MARSLKLEHKILQIPPDWPEEQGAIGSQVVPLLMWAHDSGQGAQLCLISPVGQLVLAHPLSGQGPGVEQGGRKLCLCAFFFVWYTKITKTHIFLPLVISSHADSYDFICPGFGLAICEISFYKQLLLISMARLDGPGSWEQSRPPLRGGMQPLCLTCTPPQSLEQFDQLTHGSHWPSTGGWRREHHILVNEYIFDSKLCIKT